MKRYVYRKIASPNALRLRGQGSDINSLIISNITDSDILLSISLEGSGVQFYITKNTRVISGESLNPFPNGYSFDAEYTFVVKLNSGEADIVLILEN